MRTAAQVLDAYYLDVRCMLVEIAATLDRVDRADASDTGSSDRQRIDKLYEALAILADKSRQDDRAEALLRLFSDPIE